MLLLFSWLRELLRRDNLACFSIDGVEDHHTLAISAGTALALNLEPSIVGQSAVECSFASKFHRAQIPHRFPNRCEMHFG